MTPTTSPVLTALENVTELLVANTLEAVAVWTKVMEAIAGEQAASSVTSPRNARRMISTRCS